MCTRYWNTNLSLRLVCVDIAGNDEWILIFYNIFFSQFSWLEQTVVLYIHLIAIFWRQHYFDGLPFQRLKNFNQANNISHLKKKLWRYWYFNFFQHNKHQLGDYTNTMTKGNNDQNFLNAFFFTLTQIYPAHFEDVPCQSGVNHIFEG